MCFPPSLRPSIPPFLPLSLSPSHPSLPESRSRLTASPRNSSFPSVHYLYLSHANCHPHPRHYLPWPSSSHSSLFLSSRHALSLPSPCATLPVPQTRPSHCSLLSLPLCRAALRQNTPQRLLIIHSPHFTHYATQPHICTASFLPSLPDTGPLVVRLELFTVSLSVSPALPYISSASNILIYKHVCM